MAGFYCSRPFGRNRSAHPATGVFICGKEETRGGMCREKEKWCRARNSSGLEKGVQAAREGTRGGMCREKEKWCRARNSSGVEKGVQAVREETRGGMCREKGKWCRARCSF